MKYTLSQFETKLKGIGERMKQHEKKSCGEPLFKAPTDEPRGVYFGYLDRCKSCSNEYCMSKHDLAEAPLECFHIYKGNDAPNGIVLGEMGKGRGIRQNQSKNDRVKEANEENRGLVIKYRVYKAENDEPLEDCFVLRPDKDPAARAAMFAYAEATDNPMLARDIRGWMAAINSSAFNQQKASV